MDTSKSKELLLEQLKKTPIVETACQKLNIGRSTYYYWRKEDSEFAKRADAALQDGSLLVNDLAESQLIAAIKDRNIPGISLWLRTHHPAYKTRIEIDGTVNTIQEMSPEQKELVKKALELAKINLDKHEPKQ